MESALLPAALNVLRKGEKYETDRSKSNQLCTGIMNWFVGEYYVDDKYGIVDERNENYDIYKKYIKENNNGND